MAVPRGSGYLRRVYLSARQLAYAGAGVKQLSLARRGSALRLLVRLLLNVHAAWYLVPRLPITAARLIRRLTTERTVAGRIYALGRRDAAFRGWYAKIAEDMARHGRFAYIWNDGFGAPLGTRFYNNAGTYLLYGLLGASRWVGLSVLLFALSTVLVFAWAGKPSYGLMTLPLILLSPVFVAAQTHAGKPEILWWALVLPALCAVLLEEWAVAGALFSLLAFVCFTPAFFTGVMVGAALLVGWPGTGAALALLLWMLPGLAKTALRLVPFLRSEWGRMLFASQTNAAAANRIPGEAPDLPRRLRQAAEPAILVYSLFYVAGLGAVVLGGGAPLAYLPLGVLPLALYFLSQNLFRLADAQSFWMLHLSLLVALLAIAPSVVGVAGVTGFAFTHPRFLGVPLRSGPLRSLLSEPATGVRAELRSAAAELESFPALAPIPASRSEAAVHAFLGCVPAGSRVALESRGCDRMLDGLQPLLDEWSIPLSARGIKIVPDLLAVCLTPDLVQALFSRFNESSDAECLFSTCEQAGAGWAIAHTARFADRLEGSGFARIGEFDLTAYREVLPGCTAEKLVLLRVPRPCGVVTARGRPVATRDRDNALCWDAAAGESYEVRFAWVPGMMASQGDHELAVQPITAAPGTAVRFMRITAIIDGELCLRVRKSLL
jgi:hypothetical protein